MTFNTPVEAAPDNQCGRVVLTDIHVGRPGGLGREPGQVRFGRNGTPFPSGCRRLTLSPQEKALEFLFFDLRRACSPTPPRPCRRPVPPPGTPVDAAGGDAGAATVPPPPPPPPPAADSVAGRRRSGAEHSRVPARRRTIALFKCAVSRQLELLLPRHAPSEPGVGEAQAPNAV